MKGKIVYTIIVLFAVVSVMGAMVYAKKPVKDNNTEIDNTVHAIVTLPSLPEYLDFAGERVPLENFDTRESLDREMLVTLNMHSRTALTLLNTQRYFSVIEPIMEAHGIPADFKYLCMAESGLSPDASSSAGAAGLWQIMPDTGRELGLLVGREVDERFHIEKSTEAACEYLKKSYEMFGSWTLAAAAYNVGNNGVTKRQALQSTECYYDTFLPLETLRYIFRILSLKIVTENQPEYGYIFNADQYYAPFTNWYEVEISDKDIDWSQFAAANGTNYKMLRVLNPWIRDYKHTNSQCKTYTVKIPGPDFRKGSLEATRATKRQIARDQQ